MIWERPKLIIGVDPGDKWIGVASLRIKHGTKFKAQMAVRNRSIDTFMDVVRQVVPTPKEMDRYETVLVTERYQERGAGYRRGNTGDTLQLIGALRYATEVSGGRWTEAIAADPGKELPKYPTYPYIKDWLVQCPRSFDSRWLHACSAWRVLSYYMMMNRPLRPVLLALQTQPPKSLIYDGGGADDGFTLVAPNLSWSLT